MYILRNIPNVNPRLSIGCKSIIGNRSYQQDYLGIVSNKKTTMAVICDGMGGMQGGELASSLGVNTICENFLSTNKNIYDFYLEQVKDINKKVNDLIDEKGEKLNSGTTIVSVSIEGDELYWLSVGDSGIFLIRDEKLMKLNREHNYLYILKNKLADGKISEDEYYKEAKTRRADALISYLGINELELIDINKKALRLISGDIVVLCSDGITKSLTDDQLKALVLDNNIDFGMACEKLCQKSLEYGKGVQDNTSIILLEYR